MDEKLIRIASLKAAIEARGMNAPALARLMGVAPAYIYALLSGKKDFGEKAARRIEESLELARGALDQGVDIDARSSTVTSVNPRLRVPLVPLGVWPPEPGGDTILCPVTHSTSTVAVILRGDSMDSGSGRRYPAGTIVYIDPEVIPSDGRAVLARLDGGELTVRLLREEAGERWLAPLHPHYPLIRRPFEVLGTVIGSFIPE